MSKRPHQLSLVTIERLQDVIDMHRKQIAIESCQGGGKGPMLKMVEDDMVRHVRAMRDAFRASEPVRLSPTEYETAVQGMRKNIELIRPKTTSALKLLREDAMMPKAIEVRMPLMRDSDDRDLQCKACSANILGDFVPSLVCLRGKMHPACAAVIIEKLGARTFYECVGHLNHHKPTGEALRRRMECHHKPISENAQRAIEEALEEFKT